MHNINRSRSNSQHEQSALSSDPGGYININENSNTNNGRTNNTNYQYQQHTNPNMNTHSQTQNHNMHQLNQLPNPHNPFYNSNSSSNKSKRDNTFDHGVLNVNTTHNNNNLNTPNPFVKSNRSNKSSYRNNIVDTSLENARNTNMNINFDNSMNIQKKSNNQFTLDDYDFNNDHLPFVNSKKQIPPKIIVDINHVDQLPTASVIENHPNPTSFNRYSILNQKNFMSIDTLNSEEIKKDLEDIRMEDDLKIMKQNYNTLLQDHETYKSNIDELIKTFENSYEVLEK